MDAAGADEKLPRFDVAELRRSYRLPEPTRERIGSDTLLRFELR